MKRLLSGLVLSLPMIAAYAGSPDLQRQAELSTLLVQDCGSCHGLTMKGGLGPRLTRDRISGFSEAYLVDAILNGRGGTAMPPWNALLTADDARWIAQRLKTGDYQ